jgi:signal transduction histidine kinase
MQSIEYQVSRGARLVNNIRKLSDLEEYKSKIEPIEFTIILEDIILNLREKYKEKNIEIQVKNQNKKNLILANKQLRDVFENILINAIIHNENRKINIIIKISREIKKAIRYIKFEILDNGTGISNGEKNSIFKREYYIDKSLTGQGLGLVIVKKIIDAYNGQIWVEDRTPGKFFKGSNFIFLIPEAF